MIMKNKNNIKEENDCGYYQFRLKIDKISFSQVKN